METNERKIRYTMRMKASTFSLLKELAEKESRPVAKEVEHIIKLYATLYHKALIKQ